MEEQRHDIEEVIIKWLSGDATVEEAEKLTQLAAKDQEIRDLIAEYQHAWNLTDPELSKVGAIDVDTEWKTLSSRISIEDDELTVEAETAKKDTKVRSLLVDSYSAPGWRSYSRIAAVLFLVAVSAFAIISYLYSPTVRYTAADNIQDLQLPDGSLVSLNQNSLVKFNDEFKGKKREVYLEGEALFEVEPNPSKPFVVKTDWATIEVLGTKFNVKAYYDGGRIELSVLEGKVAFTSMQGEERIVSANQSISYYKEQQQFTEIEVVPANSTAWKTRIVDFDNTSLSEVVETLQSVYQVEFNFENEQLRDCSITVQFEDQDIESVLTVIEATLNIELELNNGIVTISGSGC